MANVLKMTIVQSILSLHAQGWSQHRIADQLGIDRETVSHTFGWHDRRYSRTPATFQNQPLRRLTRPGVGRFKSCPSADQVRRRRSAEPLCRRGRSSFWPSMARDYRPSGFIRTCPRVGYGADQLRQRTAAPQAGESCAIGARPPPGMRPRPRGSSRLWHRRYRDQFRRQTPSHSCLSDRAQPQPQGL